MFGPYLSPRLCYRKDVSIGPIPFLPMTTRTKTPNVKAQKVVSRMAKADEHSDRTLWHWSEFAYDLSRARRFLLPLPKPFLAFPSFLLSSFLGLDCPLPCCHLFSNPVFSYGFGPFIHCLLDQPHTFFFLLIFVLTSFKDDDAHADKGAYSPGGCPS